MTQVHHHNHPSSTETRGDVYYGDDLWGRTNTALLDLGGRGDENKRSRIYPAPRLCWGESSCSLMHQYFSSSSNSDQEDHHTLYHSDVKTDNVGSSSSSHLILHQCSGILEDGEQLVVNVESRIRARKSLPSEGFQCSMLVEGMSMVISSLHQDQGVWLRRSAASPYDLESKYRGTSSSCKVPEAVRKLQEIACSASDGSSSDGSSSESSKRKKKKGSTCHAARQACQTTTAWLTRFDGGGSTNSTVCRDLCTLSIPPPVQPALAKKECISSESVMLSVAIKMPKHAGPTKSAMMNISVSWHGKGMERPYAGKEDRLCLYMAETTTKKITTTNLLSSNDPLLMSDVKVSSFYEELTRTGRTSITLPLPGDTVARRFVVRYERRMAPNQPGCTWHAHHEVCRSTTVVVLPPFPPPKKELTKVSPPPPSRPKKSLPSRPQCKVVFDSSQTVVPLTSKEMKNEITYDTLVHPNGDRTVENIQVPDSRVKFFVGFKLDDENCVRTFDDSLKERKGSGSGTRGTTNVILEDDVLWCVK